LRVRTARPLRPARLRPLAVAVLALALVAAGQPALADPQPARAAAKVDRRLLDRLGAKATGHFFVVLRPEANLAGLPARREARTGAVVERLQDTADASQAGLKALLRARKAPFESFWIANTIRVEGNQALARALAARPEVERVVAETDHPLPAPTPAEARANIQAVEWNLDRVRAPEVWSTFGDRGEGVVVANVDTGVQFDHPALVNAYRGNKGDGTFDHNYNWFDPTHACPTAAPCDNNGHGSHTMGTMVGDDGAGTQTGVAPGARWIAAKGCESSSCSDAFLLAAGQWMLAPTDASGANPRPDLAPHVVNNSWGSGPGDPFYADIVQSWVAGGIFPVFSNGNSGPACGSAGGPGDQVPSYSVGAFDSANAIAGFSSRGPAANGGETKPNIAAPGVAIRSSVPGNGYAAFNGTSMAAPHVAGTVALIWAAAPTLVRNVAATRQLLDDTAVDTPATQCGGTDDDNNVFGEGRLDAFAAVDQAPRGTTGTVQGTVTDAGGQAVAGATVRTAGPAARTTTSADDGTWRLTLPVGTYTVTVGGFGWQTVERPDVAVTADAATTVDVTLTAAARRTVTGVVRDQLGAGVTGAAVSVPGTPVAPVTTGADGAFTLTDVPDGHYTLLAERDACLEEGTVEVTVDADVAVELVTPRRQDGFGHVCDRAPAELLGGVDQVMALGGDDATAQLALPFAFPFYGATYETAHVSTNGLIAFPAPSAAYLNGAIPSAAAPNGAVYGLWDDLYVDGPGQVRTQVLGEAPARQVVVEWHDVRFLGTSARFSFQVVLSEGGGVEVRYGNLPADDRGRGASATVGVEDATGTDALQYSTGRPSLTAGTMLRFRTIGTGVAQGTVTDANDGQPVAGATVRASRGGTAGGTATTDQAGAWTMELAAGAWTVEAAAERYRAASRTVTVTEGTTPTGADLALATGRVQATPEALELTATEGGPASGELTVANTGGAPLAWRAEETGGDVAWLTVAPAEGTVAPGASQALTVTADPAGLEPGTYTATLTLTSDTGRGPAPTVRLSFVVPAPVPAPVRLPSRPGAGRSAP
jgi:subtilisin family serine protease